MNAHQLGRFGTAHQTSWDWRAAINFICGGAGAALLAAAALFGFPAPPALWIAIVACVLIGIGLLSVWHEIGRPQRALNVLFHPQTSWMTREAFVAGALFLLVATALFVGSGLALQLAGLGGLLFLYCQSRILRAARGVPAWREPAIVPLVIATGLLEGVGLLAVLSLFSGGPTPAMALALTVLLLLRQIAWQYYLQRMRLGRMPASTAAILDETHRQLLRIGTLPPMIAAVLALLIPSLAFVTLTIAAIIAVASGAMLKFVLITRTAQVQGYALGNKLRRGHPLAGAR